MAPSLRDWRAPALLTALVLLAYAGSAPNGFLYDDAHAVAANPVVNGRLPLSAVWTHDFWGQGPAHTVGSYRPVTDLTLAFDWRIGNGAPWVFRASSIAWHLACVLAVFFVWQSIVGTGAALLAASFFAVLAAPSEAVLCAVGRADVLCALFMTLGLGAFRRSGWGWAGVTAGCFGVALGAKESAIVAPLAWLAIDALRPVSVRKLRTRVLALLPCVVPLALYVAGRRIAMGTLYAPWTNTPLHNPLLSANATGRLFGASHVFAVEYVGGLIDPWRRIYDCSAKACGPSDASDPLAWLGLLLAVGLFVSPLLVRRKPEAAAGLAWCGLLFLPASNFLVQGPTIYGERLLYAPLIGACIAASVALSRLPRPVAAGLTLIVLVPNLIAVRNRQADWNDGAKLLASGLRYAPDSAVVQVDVAIDANRAKDYPRAEQAARRAIELYPKYMLALRELASSLFAQGRLAEAQPFFERAYALGRDATLVNDYANFLARRGELNHALEVVDDYQRAYESTAELEALHAKLFRAIARASSKGAR